MKKLLILGGSEFQIPLILQAKKMGLVTCLLDRNPEAPGIACADVFYRCSLLDRERALEIAREFAPDGVTVGMCDVGVCTAAAICRELGLPGLDPATALRATDKYRMIEAFRKAGVPHPAYFRLVREELAAAVPLLPFPVISKPVDMAGSRGIEIIRSREEFSAAAARSSRSGVSGDILVEEYLRGPEVSVELLVKDGRPHVLGITDKLTSGAPHFMETGHVQPSSLPEPALARIAEAACAAARSLGLKNSLAHGEIILTEQGPRLVEIGARMGGDSIQMQLIALSAGLNLPQIAIQLALGLDFSVPVPTLSRASAIGFLPSGAGRVTALKGLSRAAAMDHVVTAAALCREGELLTEAVDNSGRSAYVITQADTPAQALDACRRALGALHLELQP